MWEKSINLETKISKRFLQGIDGPLHIINFHLIFNNSMLKLVSSHFF
jgi:hypothetical protein